MERNGMEWDEIVCSKSMQDPPKRNLGLSKLVMEAPKFEVGDVPDAHDQPRGDQAAPKSARETSKRRPRGIGWIAWVNGQTNGFGAGQRVQIEIPGGGAPPPSRQQGSEPDHPERVY